MATPTTSDIDAILGLTPAAPNRFAQIAQVLGPALLAFSNPQAGVQALQFVAAAQDQRRKASAAQGVAQVGERISTLARTDPAAAAELAEHAALRLSTAGFGSTATVFTEMSKQLRERAGLSTLIEALPPDDPTRRIISAAKSVDQAVSLINAQQGRFVAHKDDQTGELTITDKLTGRSQVVRNFPRNPTPISLGGDRVLLLSPPGQPSAPAATMVPGQPQAAAPTSPVTSRPLGQSQPTFPPAPTAGQPADAVTATPVPGGTLLDFGRRGPHLTGMLGVLARKHGYPTDLSQLTPEQSAAIESSLVAHEAAIAEIRRRAQSREEVDRLMDLPMVLLNKGVVPLNTKTWSIEEEGSFRQVLDRDDLVAVREQDLRTINRTTAMIGVLDELEAALPRVLATRSPANLFQALRNAVGRRMGHTALAEFDALNGNLLGLAGLVQGDNRVSDLDAKTVSGFRPQDIDTVASGKARIAAARRSLMRIRAALAGINPDTVAKPPALAPGVTLEVE